MDEWKSLVEVKEYTLTTYKELQEKIKSMTFEEAYKSLNGTDLESYAFYDSAKERIVVSLQFNVKYKNIITTIFNCGENNEDCELWECVSYPFGHAEIVFDCNGKAIEPYEIISSGNVITL